MANSNTTRLTSVYANITDPQSLRDILDHVPDGVLAFDKECRYTVWNSAMESISGLSRNEVLGRNAFESSHFSVKSAKTDIFMALLQARLNTARTANIESLLRNGKVISTENTIRYATEKEK